MTTQRFVPGIGRAAYIEIEDVLARDLIALGAHPEVAVLHELKVALDATPVADDPTWLRETHKVAAALGVQGTLA